MTYREMIGLYKEGKLPEAARERLAAEIERQQAISDYLFECEEAEADAEAGELGLGELRADEAEERFTRAIRKSIRDCFVRTDLIVGGCVLALVLLFAILVPRVADLFYYDPLEAAADGRAGNALSADLAAFTELFRPDYYRTEALAVRQGRGEYDIRIVDRLSRGALGRDTVGKIDRGKLLLYDGSSLAPVCGLFEKDGSGDKTLALEAMRLSLAEGPAYDVCFALTGPVELSEFLARWREAGLPADGLWLAVDAELSDLDLGFFAAGPQGLLDMDAARAHFAATLRYLAGRDRFLQMCACPDGAELAALAEAAENGPVYVRGFSVTGRRDTLLMIAERPEVAAVRIRNAE